MRVCVVVPMHNEEVIAELSIKTILHYIYEISSDIDLLVVNDGSKDNTEKILNCLIHEERQKRLKLISHSRNLGYGMALRTGIKFAIDNNYDYIIFMDSDLTNHPRYLKDFYEKMNQGWEYIKATRYSKGGRVEGVPWCHRLLSRIGNIVARFLYGLPLTDFTNGFRAVKVEILKKMTLNETGFAIIMEELSQAKYLTDSFCEIPYILTSRKEGQGLTHFSYGPRMWCNYLRYAVKSFLYTRSPRRERRYG